MRNQADDKPLSGQIALVTGGGTGIGRGIALALARRGATLALVGRRPAPLATVVHEVEALGAQAVALPTDLTDTAARQRLLAQVHEQLGPVTLLLNNAALLSYGPFAMLSAQTLEAMVAINFTAPIALTQLCLPDLTAQRGRLILIGSGSGIVPLPYFALYSATKAGLHAFGTALRHEVAALGVQLLIAYPPATTTEMTAAMGAEVTRRGWQKLYHMATPEAVGERIVRDMLAGKRQSIWWGSESLLQIAHRFMPSFTDRVLGSQGERLAAFLRSATVANEQRAG